MYVKKADRIGPGNPFLHDHYHMGTDLGTNVTVMYPLFDSEFQPYLIVCDKTTGERIRIGFEDIENLKDPSCHLCTHKFVCRYKEETGSPATGCPFFSL